MTKPILALLLSFYTITLFAQRTLDINVGTRPLQFLETSLYPDLKYPIKKCVSMHGTDSIDVYQLDSKGNITLRYNYSNNKPVSKTIYKYVNQLKSQMVFTTKYDETITFYKYDAKKKMLEWGKSKKMLDPKIISNAESENFSWVFEYNPSGKLIKKFHVNNQKEKELNVEYVYDKNNLLTTANFKQHQVLFEYIKELLIKKSETYLPQNQVTHLFEYRYNEQEQLIEEITPHYSLQYLYESGRVKKCSYQYKMNNAKESIDFFYEDLFLKKVEILRTDYYTFSPFIFSSNYLQKNKNNLLQLKIELLYDVHKNIQEVKHFVNDVYQYSKYFIYEYY